MSRSNNSHKITFGRHSLTWSNCGTFGWLKIEHIKTHQIDMNTCSVQWWARQSADWPQWTWQQKPDSAKCTLGRRDPANQCSDTGRRFSRSHSAGHSSDYCTAVNTKNPLNHTRLLRKISNTCGLTISIFLFYAISTQCKDENKFQILIAKMGKTLSSTTVYIGNH